MKKLSVSLLGLAAFSPVLAFAATTSLYGIMGFISDVVRWGGPLLGAIAILYFIWQVIRYTIAGDEEEKKDAKTKVVWAVVGIFVIFSIWGLVNILQNTFAGQGTVQNVILPTIPL
jgi:hypothetical protein